MKTNSRLLGDLFAMAIEVNLLTDRAVFCYLHGHVVRVHLHVSPSNDKALNFDIDPNAHEADVKIFAAMTYLQSFLPRDPYIALLDPSLNLDQVPNCDLVATIGDMKLHPSFEESVAVAALDSWDRAMDKGIIEGLGAHTDLVHRTGGAENASEIHPYPFGRHPYDSHGIEY